MDENSIQNENNLIPKDKPQRSFLASKTKLLILVISFLSLLSITTYSYLYLSKSNSKYTSPKTLTTSSTVSNFKKDKNSVAIYTRCFDGKRQPSKCNLYSSKLEQPEEKLIYSFNFPKVKQNDYEVGFQLKLIGQIDNKIVYQTSYWNNPREDDITIFGFIDLTNAKNTEIFKIVNKIASNTPKEYLLIPYLDTLGKKIYYSTEKGPDKNSKVYQYDIVKMQNKELINDKIIKNTSLQVISTNNNKIFLSLIARIGAHTYWDYTYDLISKKLSKKELTINDPVFDKSGKKYAYVMEEQTSDKSFYNLRLMIGDTTTLVEKEIFSIPSVRVIPGDGGCDPAFSCSYIAAREFDHLGNQLLYTVSNYSKGDQKYENQSYIYTEIPNNEDTKFKNIYKITPQKLQPRWVNFYRSGPGGDEDTKGLLYEYNDAWFIKPIYENSDSDVDLLSHMSVQDLISIVTNVNNVIIVP